MREAGHISATGLCPEHSLARHVENTAQLQVKRGPFAQWWAAKIAVSVGLYPLDELPPRP